MLLNIIFKLLAGAILGGVVGFFLGKARACGTTGCNLKASRRLRVYYVLALAVLGMAISWYVMHR